MAVRFDATADVLTISSSLPGGTPFSCSFWMRLASDINAQGVIFYVGNTSATTSTAIGLGTDGTTIQIGTQNGSTTGTSLTVGTWYHIGYRRNGATHELYLNGTLDVSRSDNNSLTMQRVYLGSFGGAAQRSDIRVANLKMWNADITATGLGMERWIIQPDRWENLYSWHPMFSGSSERVKDWSGNGHDFTAGGTLTDEDHPPVPMNGYNVLFSPAVAQTKTVGTANVSLSALSPTGVPGSITAPLNKPDVAIAAFGVTGALSYNAAMNAAAVTLAAQQPTAIPGSINAPLNKPDVAIAALQPTGVPGSINATVNTPPNVTIAANGVTAVPSVDAPIGTANVTLAAISLTTFFIQPVGFANVAIAALQPTALPGSINATVGTTNVSIVANGFAAALGSINAPLNFTDVALSAKQPTALPGSINATIGTTNVTLAALQVTASLGAQVATLNTTDVALSAKSPTAVPGSINAALGFAAVTLAALQPTGVLGAQNAPLNAAAITLSAFGISASVGAVTVTPGNTNISVSAFGVDRTPSINSAVGTANINLSAFSVSRSQSLTTALGTTNVALNAFAVNRQVSDLNAVVGVAGVTFTAYPMTYQTNTNAVGSANVLVAAYDVGLPPTPAERQIRIQPEDRAFIIPHEDRSFTIPDDGREFLIE